MSNLLTEEHKKYIKENYKELTNKELFENLKFIGYKGGMTTVRKYKYANDLKKPKEGCFCKEYERTWWIGKNKENFPELWDTETRKVGYEKLKGRTPVNRKAVGTVYNWKRDKNNRYKKVRTEKGLKDYHIYLWEQANGKVPEGYCLKFLDNNPNNCVLSNLRLCKRETVILAMRKGFTNYSDLNEELLKIAELKGVIKNVRNKNRK